MCSFWCSKWIQAINATRGTDHSQEKEKNQLRKYNLDSEKRIHFYQLWLKTLKRFTWVWPKHPYFPLPLIIESLSSETTAALIYTVFAKTTWTTQVKKMGENMYSGKHERWHFQCAEKILNSLWHISYNQENGTSIQVYTDPLPSCFYKCMSTHNYMDQWVLQT